MAASQPLAAEAADREGGDMASEPGPSVLLGNLGPIMRLGMNRVLSEEGCHVVGQEDRPRAIIGAAHRLRPDIVVLDLDNGSSHELAQLVRGASPETTVVLWAPEEDLMEVLEPVWNTSRLVAVPVVERLRSELSGQHVHEGRRDMPTYLTPGVYAEEAPSANKPIEGVSTSIAAFVGLAPGGPVNTPMRISNWTQFAKIYGDPNEPDNGPFMEGAYLAHSVYGFFQNGGSLCWIVRVGDDGGSAAPRAALPAAADSSIEAFNVVALESGNGDLKVELTEEPSVGEKDAEQTYKLVVSSGSDKEEHSGLTLKKGRSNLATKVNSASKLIKVEETGASLPEAQRVPATGSYTLSKPSIDPSKVKPTHFEGDVSRRQGMGGLAAVDEVTMVCMPDIMNLAADGDDVQVRDLQGKMIAHCENAGDRMAILDCPPDMLPQDILEWRMNTAGYDSKFAALYYPWIEVMNPLTNQPIMIPPSGHIAGVWCRTDSTR